MTKQIVCYKVNREYKFCLNTCVNQLVLLQMCELGEVFQTSRLGAGKGPLTSVGSYVHFQVTQLAKDLFTGITPVYNLSVLLFQGKW